MLAVLFAGILDFPRIRPAQLSGERFPVPQIEAPSFPGG
jgi:hypothetical protein